MNTLHHHLPWYLVSLQKLLHLLKLFHKAIHSSEVPHLYTMLSLEVGILLPCT
ncbi:hypothetical protein HOLleu_42028 [Holothuria leucospilota]|uniref:Uncharacterized protein n=1 Tax=Holothuria leucospilota TaxID=206669 RepID=A0A9Q1BCG9_HOLLE|nr:hypothetical protein HOLleu_42028 [Holothuria leucospilota]